MRRALASLPVLGLGLLLKKSGINRTVHVLFPRKNDLGIWRFPTVESLNACDVVLGQREACRVRVHGEHQGARVGGMVHAEGVAKLVGRHKKQVVVCVGGGGTHSGTIVGMQLRDSYCSGFAHRSYLMSLRSSVHPHQSECLLRGLGPVGRRERAVRWARQRGCCLRVLHDRRSFKEKRQSGTRAISSATN